MRPALVAGLILAAAPATATAGAMTLIFENDIFAGLDEQYTNGAYLRWTPDALPALGRWGKAQGAALTGPAEWRMTFGLGQAMFAPSDLTLRDPPLDDRPYAGFLFGTVALSADRGDRLDTVAIDIGVVGPPSLAEEAQKFVHTFIGDDPEGWDTQLGTEIAFRAVYEQHRRLGLGRLAGFETDAIPQATLALGTLDTSATGTLTLRIGEGLAKDYGPPRLRRSVADVRAPGGDGWYLFASAEGRVVGRNLFLEGNSFRDSRSVDPERAVGELAVGASVEWRGAVVTYSHAFRSPEFTTRDDWTEFGSLSLRLEF